MTDDRAADLRLNRELWGVVNAQYTDAAATGLWARDELAWGLFGIPERDLGALGEVRGRDVLELACGTAYFSAWLAKAGARPVALDFSAEQVATARERQRQGGPAFPLVQADAERLPLADRAFDVVVSEHGAAAWCDPARWLAEAARVLRPGGRLAFLTNSALSALCVPAEGGVAGDRLLRGHAETRPVQWPGGGVEFHPSHGDWVRLLRSAGFAIEALHELHAPPDSDPHEYYEIVAPAWAGRWPAEELWVATLAGPRPG